MSDEATARPLGNGEPGSLVQRPIAKVYALPDDAINQQGIHYDPRLDRWPVSASTMRCDLPFEQFRDLLTPEFLVSTKLALIDQNRVLKGSSMHAVKDNLLRFFRYGKQATGGSIDALTLGLVQGWWLNLTPDQKSEYGYLRRFARKVARVGDPAHGVDEDALAFMECLKIPGNPMGRAALSWDPLKGPLTDMEDATFLNALHGALEQGEIEYENYVLVLIHRFSGMRAAQIADLKARDLKVEVQADGTKRYTLMFPRGKEQHEQFRAHLVPKQLTPQIGALIEGLVVQQADRYKALDCPPEDLPLFVHKVNKDPIRSFHYVAGSLGKRLGEQCKALNVITRRTGKPIRIRPRRFRMSLATWALRQGATIYEIAELLDLKDTASLEHYVAIDPEILEEINARMANTEVPLANAFLGKVSDQPTAPNRAIYPAVFKSSLPVGGCEPKCLRPKPYACYVCRQFVAAMDGPHEEVLEGLLVARAEIIAKTGDPALAGINQDVIDAVQNVIVLRDQRRKTLAGGQEQVQA
jgi:integrase